MRALHFAIELFIGICHMLFTFLFIGLFKLERLTRKTV
jgi:hypothetical protein